MRYSKTIYPLLGCFLSAQLICVTQLSAQDGLAYTSNQNKTTRHDTTPRSEDKGEQKTLFTVLKELNKSKGTYFLFSEEGLTSKLVNPVKDATEKIEKILDDVLKDTGLKFKKVSDNTYVILSVGEKLKKNTDLNAVDFGAADRESSAFETITGKILAADGTALPGVSISIKGSGKGTTTNNRGEFSIEANRGEVLVISYIGYTTQEVTVGDDRSLSISLALSGQEMSEVVVTALGIRKESKRLGYSVTKVDGEGLTKARETNVANSLVGKVAGVNVSGVNGGPGSSSNVVIRGVNSFGGSSPLYVINGVPMSNNTRGSAGQWGGADFGDGISNINPDDIEEITVLKGSTASALYGSRASGGVILITTKSGANKKGIGVEVNSNFTTDQIIDHTDFQYIYGQGQLGVKPANQAAAYQTGSSSWGGKTDGGNTVQFDGVSRPYSAQKDNIQNFYRSGYTATNTVALSGGNENGNFRLSASNLLNNSVVPNSGLSRNSLNLNVGGKLSKKLIVSIILNYIVEKADNRPNLSDSPGNSNFGITFLPTTLDQSVLKPGTLANGNEINFSNDVYVTNPWFAANKFVNNLKRNRIIAMGSLRYNFTDWLYVQGRIGHDFSNDRSHSVTPTGTAYYPAGNITENGTRINEMNSDFLVGVDRKITQDIGFSASVGGNLLRSSYENLQSTGDQFSIPFLYVLDNAKNKNADYGYTKEEVQSVYYTAEFSYKNFLFLNTTGREDWFSTLPKDNNHLFYPSVSASFVFSELVKPSFLDYGKVRVAWANTSGKANPYQTKLYYSIGGSINGNPIGIISNSLVPNAALEPFRLREFEVGLEARFLKSRIQLDVAYFNRKTIKEIVGVPASITSGYNGATINIGEMENKGIEAMVSGVIVKNRQFSWTSSVNVTKLKNKIQKLADGQSSLPLATSRSLNAFVHHVVGLPASQIMAFDYKRNDAGDIVYDANGLPQQGLLIPMGSGFHDFFGGWNNEVTFKGFNFGVLIDFKSGGKLYSATNFYGTIDGLTKLTLEGRETGIVGDGVNENGDKNAVNAKSWDYYGALSSISSQFVYNASFIKLRQIVIGYNLPADWFAKGPFRGINVSLVARNLAVLKKHTPNIDPESNYNNSVAQGLELAGVPPFRSFGINLNVKL